MCNHGYKFLLFVIHFTLRGSELIETSALTALRKQKANTIYILTTFLMSCFYFLIEDLMISSQTPSDLKLVFRVTKGT